MILVSLTSCFNQHHNVETSFGHPFDSINKVMKHNSGIWKIEYTDSTNQFGDSLMYYSNDTLAKIIPFFEDKRRGFVEVFDSSGNWTTRFEYLDDTQTVGVKVAYPLTGLINYNYHLVNKKPTGVYRQFYNYLHDSVIYNGYVYPRSTHLKEYRLYNLNSQVWFKQKYFEDQSIKYDSGHSIIPFVVPAPHIVNEPLEVTFWIASPREIEEKIIVRNGQTGQRDTLFSSTGEVSYTFIPKKTGFYKFTVFHNLTDTISSEIRRDSVTYKLNVVKKR